MFFRRKRTKEVQPTWVKADYFKILSPSEIYTHPISGTAYFWEGHDSEEHLLPFVKKYQPLIEEYESTGDILIEYPEEIPMNDPTGEIQAMQAKETAKFFMLDPLVNVDVKKRIDGLYEANRGYHRMYVAKKYGLRLLVHVSTEDI